MVTCIVNGKSVDFSCWLAQDSRGARHLGFANDGSFLVHTVRNASVEGLGNHILLYRRIIPNISCSWLIRVSDVVPPFFAESSKAIVSAKLDSG